MLARFDWQFRHRSTLVGTPGRLVAGWIVLATAVIILLAWALYRHAGQPAWLADLPAFLRDALTLLEAAAAVTLLALAAILSWRTWARRAPARPTVADLYALSPAEFERYVAALFRRKGYDVRVRGRSGDHGVDLELLRPDGRRAIVQCKRYRNAIGPDVVRELLGTMIHEQVHHAFLVTTADISSSAREWALSKPITLIDGRDLVQLAAALGEPDGARI